MKDFQTASQIERGQAISVESNGTWTEPSRVLHVQHNRLSGRTPQGVQLRGVVVLFADGNVASMDDDTIVKRTLEVAHA